MIAYIFAGLSAFFAALVAIFGKLGLTHVDPTAATAVRAVIMATVLLLGAIVFKKLSFDTLGTFGGKGWLFIVLAGLAGAISWLFYFIALKYGSASHVAAIDRLSIVFVVILAALFLGETFTWATFFGALLMVFGALMIAFL